MYKPELPKDTYHAFAFKNSIGLNQLWYGDEVIANQDECSNFACWLIANAEEIPKPEFKEDEDMTIEQVIHLRAYQLQNALKAKKEE